MGMKKLVLSTAVLSGLIAGGLGVGVGTAAAAPDLARQGGTIAHTTFNDSACMQDRGFGHNIKKYENGRWYEVTFFAWEFKPGCKAWYWRPL